MLKMLLYCCKAKPELYNTDKGFVLTDFGLGEYYNNKVLLNGKIVAECDFEVEEIRYWYKKYEGYSDTHYYTSGLLQKDLLKRSCLRPIDIANYLPKPFFKDKGQIGYAIHIKNLHIFDEPRELSKCHYLTLEKGFLRQIKKAPQNMCYALTTRDDKDILISIRPEWLCKILNGKKTIEVRKKVLKEMLE